MRKFRIWGAILIIALVLSPLPQIAGAKITSFSDKVYAASKTYDNHLGKTPPRHVSKNKKNTYVDGEAIILVRSSKNSKSLLKGSVSSGDTAFGKSDLPKGAKIEQKVHFDESSSSDAKEAGSFGQIDKKAKLKSSGGYVDKTMLATGIDIIRIKSSSLSTKELIKQLKKNSKVIYAEPNYKTHTSALTPPLNDAFSGSLWHLDNTGQNGGTAGNDVDYQAPYSANMNGNGYVVAVLDTGFDFTHEDLAGVAWNNTNTAKLAGKHGYDFFNEDTDPQDDNGHGTHVAGIIAAQHNSIGVAGVAPGVKIMPLKIFDSFGFGDTYTAIEAYEYIYKAMDLGVNVKAINNSWGGWDDGTGNILKTVIDRVGDAGAISICAAGNDYSELTDRSESVPSGIDSPYVVSVAATTEKGELAAFSNFSKDLVDLAAPGTSILSTVSYPAYNPLIGDPSLNNVYADFDSGVDASKVLQKDSLDGENWVTEAQLTQNTSDFFGESGGSLNWVIPNGKTGEIYNLYIPYTPSATSTYKDEIPIKFHADVNVVPQGGDDWYGGDVLFSDVKLVSESGVDTIPKSFKTFEGILTNNGFIGGMYVYSPWNNWVNISETLAEEVKDTSPHALVLSYVVNEDGPTEIHLDNIGISNTQKEDVYPKYEFYSGTSMATPVVTGAAALVAQSHPEYSAKKLSAKVKTMTSPSAALADKVKSGGVLDLSTYSAPGKPWIETAAISGQNVKLSGFFFGSSAGTVQASVGGTSVGSLAPSAWKDEEVTLPAANLKNRIVDFTLTKGSDTAKAKVYVVKGKASFTEDDLFLVEGALTFGTDGNTIYVVDDTGQVYYKDTYEDSYDDEDDDDYYSDFYSANEGDSTTTTLWAPGKEMKLPDIFPAASESQLKNGEVSIDGGFPYMDGKFYGIAVLDSGSTAEYALAAFDVTTQEWTRIADRPGAELKGAPTATWSNLRHSTLAAYNGKLYLIGGYNGANDTASTLVKVYDPATNKWADGPALPSSQGRFYSEARQVGSNLILTLGGNGSSDETKTPDNLIFNGTAWTAAPGIKLPGSAQYYEKKPYYTAAIGVVSGGLIYTGLSADMLGDTYTYNIAGKKYTASDYQLSQDPNSIGTGGTVVDNVLYASKEVAPGRYSYYESGYSFEEVYIPGPQKLFEMPVVSGMHNVSGAHKGGTVQGHGTYLSGQKVTLKAVPNKGYYFKQLKVDGKVIKGNTHSFRVQKDTKADATFAKYKTKVKLNKKSVSLKPGKSVQLKAKVTKPKDGIKGVKWTSSNPKYASVSKKGKVTAKAAGLGKTVVIKATAKDGSKVYAKATIKIFTKKITRLSLKAKSSSVKEGKKLTITAVFSPGNGVLKTLRWKVSDPEYAYISSKGVLTAEEGSKGKTITITAYATDGSGKKATIKIKIK